jgi:hypothetical protein
VLCHLNAPIIDQLFDDGQYALDDGLSARIVRLGPEQAFQMPQAAQSAGQYPESVINLHKNAIFPIEIKHLACM